ncbi:enoyl-CoA hydratase/isomerase family protein [Dactylosporangium roseum]|uniref:Enoyl-CoA hydratase/isomerase family protein n=1 Tax=Dactylosporangium roseum TaxID=47989 RepID=A0ABY5Z1M0_9ACTN|nr:enoyl-CoA hydratase-related protein [Dactylosporangium roseum]UWZ35554.1 enoyl-CoA hydratase/isomerase family protein [Dactylosporangium roseum]
MSLVRAQTERGVATLTLDSPSNRNALSTALIEELLAALAAAEADDTVRVVVLSHTGPVFCSGADLKETAAAFGTGKPPINRLGEVLTAIWEGHKPVVARVAGPARAGGLGLIAAADLAVCTLDATFAFSEVRIGVIPAVISATVLPRLSPRAATELFLTGDTFDGARAAEVGLVTAAVDVASLDAAVAGYVAALIRGAPGALAGTRQLLRRRKSDTFRDDVAELTELSVRYFGSDEGVEGILAFREKRDPNWIPDGA